jgi:hypothetical protein
MNTASQFIIDQKAKLEGEIRYAIEGFRERTGFHPSLVDVRIYENRIASGAIEYVLGKIDIEMI